MGFSITWCAFREEKTAELIESLRLKPTGERDDGADSPVVAGKLNTGWRILWCNKYGCSLLAPKVLTDLSRNAEILLCLVEEHVMASSAELWSEGKLKWRISHQGDHGPKGIKTVGHPPESYPAIREEMEKAQLEAGGDKAEVDYIFEIPLKVAQGMVGFKHDEPCPHLQGGTFEVMSREEPEMRAGFWQRLLGR